MTQDCATPAGKGEGGKSKIGEGFGKGRGNADNGSYGKQQYGKGFSQPYSGGKAWSPKGFGKGKGFQGACWKCGEVGHRASECKSGIKEVGVNSQEVASIQVGGVWQLAAVECETTANGQEKEEKGPKYNVSTSNSFEVLETLGNEKHQNSKNQDGRLPKPLGSGSFVDFPSLRYEEEFPKLGDWFQVARKGKKSQKQRKAMSRGKEGQEVCIAAVGNSHEDSIALGLGFQVADVKKPLLAVKRICEKGNLVQFGSEPKDNFILIKQTGDKVLLRKKRGSYVMDVSFPEGAKTEIIVDSAAEE